MKLLIVEDDEHIFDKLAKYSHVRIVAFLARKA